LERRAEAAKRGSNGIGDDVSERFVRFALADLVALAEVLDADGDFTREAVT